MAETFDPRKARIVTYRRLIVVIRGLAAGLASVFVYLRFHGFPFGDFFSPVVHEYVLQIAIAVFYSCWVFGSVFDVQRHEDLFVSSSGEFTIRLREWTWLLVHAGVFFFLSAARSLVGVSAAVLVFKISDVAGLRYIVKRFVIPDLERARIRAAEAPLHWEQACNLNRFFAGRCRRVRSVFDIAWAAALFLVVVVGTSFPSIPVLSGVSAFYPHILFSLILVSEAWLWAERLRLSVSTQMIASIAEKYVVEPVHSE